MEYVKKGQWLEIRTGKLHDRKKCQQAHTNLTENGFDGQEATAFSASTTINPPASTAKTAASDAASSKSPTSPVSMPSSEINSAASLLRIPPKLLHKLQRDGGIQASGDRLRFRLFPQETPSIAAEWEETDVLYEDDFCLVVNKPAGVKVHATAANETGALAGRIAAYYESTGQLISVRHIHRLDEDTSGPVLYAKNEYAHIILDEAMREKRIERIYVAIVSGRLAHKSGRIDAPIGRDRHHPVRRRVSQSGDRAVTLYETIETYADCSLVRLRLETGRTHQIRVHMKHLGHPLLGDVLYGGPMRLIERQALHGERLCFAHPFNNEPIVADAPWPEDIHALVEYLRSGKK